jgi:hypothetical protein
MRKVFFFLILLIFSSYCDVKNTDGVIIFDRQFDGQAEMTLNSTGLGIGVLPSSNLHINGNSMISTQLFIGGSDGSSNLNVNGTIGYEFQTVTSSTNLSGNSMVFIDTSLGDITISLPDASTMTGRKYMIKKTSPLNIVTIQNEDGSDIEIYEELSLLENSMGSLSVISASDNWHILNIDGDGSITLEGLISWWKFDETSGNTASDSSNDFNNPGSVTNIAAGNIGVASIFGRGLDLDGDDDYISITHAPSLNVGNIVSVSSWVYIRDLSGADRPAIFTTRRDNTAGSWQFELGTGNGGTGRICLTSPGAWNAETNNNVVASGNWYHIAFTKSGTNVGDTKIYLNGVSQTLLTDNPQTWVDNSSVKLIGGGTSLGVFQFFDGIIADVRIYDRALTAAEIQGLYLQGQ